MDSLRRSIAAALLLLSILPCAAVAGPPEAAAAAAAAEDADEAKNALAATPRAQASGPAPPLPSPPPPKIVPPEPGSLRARALQALAGAQELTLYSLQPWQYPRIPAAWDELPDAERERREDALVERSKRQWCKRGACFYDNRVLGRTRVAAAGAEAVRTALSQALGGVPDAVGLCAPEYRHAASFVAEGRRFDVLLCYQCDQILVSEAGAQQTGQAAAMGDVRALDAILRRAGIALAKVPTDEDE